ncbi:hypothetical protein acsn021_27440 [Anaerocolumna cellulosilytica]|uniref:CTP synthase (glutamine hydrolyzing) n=1 Tax=Anaerocolumna cellulosilytica TaxID=433286 RepID=A0A6S6R7E0_9FIRM|nr:glutamine amidotransferase [Anaerocolumna cellulosilytica]MBB5198034.1 CTP synthase (UTP-ammonia lyase) [Anaerocolumna cellulosilytica]BCJ95175.1 hypothetical protein acsn021_27440 [Anaerocolumna cellulosilytica]
MNKITIGIIGDYEENRPSHIATNKALADCGAFFGIDLLIQWLPTPMLMEDGHKKLSEIDGFIGAPGSPYKSIEGALWAIRFAREGNYPFLGTCGGFQHAVLEFARNVIGIKQAGHAETNPDYSDIFITPLSCSLVGETRKIYINEKTIMHELYKEKEAVERYNCSFGLNKSYQAMLEDYGFITGAADSSMEARILVLNDKKFYVATLFQPQLNSPENKPHKLIQAFLQNAKDFNTIRIG